MNWNRMSWHNWIWFRRMLTERIAESLETKVKDSSLYQGLLEDASDYGATVARVACQRHGEAATTFFLTHASNYVQSKAPLVASELKRTIDKGDFAKSWVIARYIKTLKRQGDFKIPPKMERCVNVKLETGLTVALYGAASNQLKEMGRSEVLSFDNTRATYK